MKKVFGILIAIIFSHMDSTSQILAPGAKLTLIDSSFSFTEGPATDKAGDIFFTDQPNDNIWKYDITFPAMSVCRTMRAGYDIAAIGAQKLITYRNFNQCWFAEYV